MTDEDRRLNPDRLARLVAAGTGLPWLETLAQLWKLGRRILRGLAEEGMYEVLEYESTLELQDRHGKRAIFRKREKVRYLQNNIIAYQDQAWADGEILLARTLATLKHET